MDELIDELQKRYIKAIENNDDVAAQEALDELDALAEYA